MAIPTRAFVVDKSEDAESSEFLYHWVNCLLITLEEFGADLETHVKLPIDGGKSLIWLVTHPKVVEMEIRLVQLLDEVADDCADDVDKLTTSAGYVSPIDHFMEEMCNCPVCQLRRKGVEEVPEWVNSLMSVVRMGLPSNLFWLKLRALGAGKLKDIYEGLVTDKPLVETDPEFLKGLKKALDEVAASAN
jgi:hypothetical protein